MSLPSKYISNLTSHNFPSVNFIIQKHHGQISHRFNKHLPPSPKQRRNVLYRVAGLQENTIVAHYRKKTKINKQNSRENMALKYRLRKQHGNEKQQVIHSYSFIPSKTYIEHLLHADHYSRYLGYTHEEKRSLHL